MKPPLHAPTMMPRTSGLSTADVAHRVDKWMAFAAVLLLTTGVAAVYSGSAVLAAKRFGSSTYFLSRHVGSVGLAALIIFGALRIPLERWSRLAYPMLGLCFTFLVLTGGDLCRFSPSRCGAVAESWTFKFSTRRVN